MSEDAPTSAPNDTEGDEVNRDCPFKRMMNTKRKKIRSKRYIPGKATSFYFLCRNGETEKVREILNTPDCPPIEELNALQPNGSTPLHAAVFYNHAEVVKLLLEGGCPRNTLNRYGCIPYAEATTREVQELFHRPPSSDRFHDSNISEFVDMYITSENNHEVRGDSQLAYLHIFESDEEIFEHAINQQTLAMWLKFYNWFANKFHRWIERDEYQVDAFNLERHADFQEFLHHHACDSTSYGKAMSLIEKARNSHSIEPLLTLYSSEAVYLYNPLNKQLASSTVDTHLGPHICDRFVMEFYLRFKELKQRAFVGVTYRGVTMSIHELEIYKRAVQHEQRSIICYKSFSSTSEKLQVALEFMTLHPPKENERKALFIFEIREKSPTVIGISDVSDHPHEEEVLALPGSLFSIESVTEDTDGLVVIRLLHVNIPVSFLKKLRQTVRCSKKPFLP